MEIELIPEPTYTVRANGREIRGMRVTGEWEGLRKLEDAQGRSLIVAEADGPLTAAMRETAGALFGNEGRRCVAVVGTPDLVFELTTAKPSNAIGQGSAACGASPAPTGCATRGEE
jgi:hypothetical protein